MRTGSIRKNGRGRRLLPGLMAALIIISLECDNVYAEGSIPGLVQLVGIGITTELNLPEKETEEEVPSNNTISAETEAASQESTEPSGAGEVSAENTTPTEKEEVTGESGSTEPQSERIQESENSSTGSESEAPPKISPVQTGDYTEIQMYVIVGIVALVVMLESIVMRKKVRNRNR